MASTFATLFFEGFMVSKLTFCPPATPTRRWRQVEVTTAADRTPTLNKTTVHTKCLTLGITEPISQPILQEEIHSSQRFVYRSVVGYVSRLTIA